MLLEELSKKVTNLDKKHPKFKDLSLLIESEEKLLLKKKNKLDGKILKNL
jgi:hypothetical protein